MLARLRFPVEQSRGRRIPSRSTLIATLPARPRPRRPFPRFPPAGSQNSGLHARAVGPFPQPPDPYHRSSADLPHLRRVLGLDEDLTEALALAHDIGHPPSPMPARRRLNHEMARFGESFDHNLHALRIVERFRAAIRALSRPEPHLRGPRGHRQALARFRPGQDMPSSG